MSGPSIDEINKAMSIPTSTVPEFDTGLKQCCDLEKGFGLKACSQVMLLRGGGGTFKKQSLVKFP